MLRKLVKSLKNNSKIKVLCLVGESGSGKSTIANLLSKDDKYNYVQSYTTRKACSSNEDGHIFVDELVYRKHKELDTDETNELKIVAETYFDGNYYWTVNTQFLKDKINVYIVDPKGVNDLKKLKKFAILTIYLKADEEIRVKRLIYREEANSEFGCAKSYEIADKRILHDKEAFRIIKADYIIDSGREAEDTLEDVKKVLKMNTEDLRNGIKKAKLKKVTQPWHKYLDGKTLVVEWLCEQFQLLNVIGEKDWIENLCKYVCENDKKLFNELGYESLNAYIEECKLGNDGFGFSKDEIEIVEE